MKIKNWSLVPQQQEKNKIRHHHLLNLLLWPQLQEVNNVSVQLRFQQLGVAVSIKDSVPCNNYRQEIPNGIVIYTDLITMTTLLFPAVYSPWVQTCIAPNKPDTWHFGQSIAMLEHGQ